MDYLLVLDVLTKIADIFAAAATVYLALVAITAKEPIINYINASTKEIEARMGAAPGGKAPSRKSP
jgi:hypothetical protein